MEINLHFWTLLRRSCEESGICWDSFYFSGLSFNNPGGVWATRVSQSLVEVYVERPESDMEGK